MAAGIARAVVTVAAGETVGTGNFLNGSRGCIDMVLVSHAKLTGSTTYTLEILTEGEKNTLTSGVPILTVASLANAAGTDKIMPSDSTALAWVDGARPPFTQGTPDNNFWPPGSFSTAQPYWLCQVTASGAQSGGAVTFYVEVYYSE